jgi:hypothetical protein
MFTFEAQAAELLLQLESLRQHWNNAEEVLLYPPDINPLKNLDHYGAIDLKLRDFKLIYGKHLVLIRLFTRLESPSVTCSWYRHATYAIV